MNFNHRKNQMELLETHNSWFEQNVLIIQDNASFTVNDSNHPINRLYSLGAKIFVSMRKTASTYEVFENCPKIAEVLVYKDNYNIFRLLKFSRSKGFDWVILYISNSARFNPKYLTHILYFLLSRGRNKLILEQKSEGSLVVIPQIPFLFGFFKNMLPFIFILISKPFIYTRNHLRGKVPIVPANIKKVLIVRLDHIGDAVMSTAIFDSLKHRFPNAEFDLLLAPWTKELFDSDPRASKIIAFSAPWHMRRKDTNNVMGSMYTHDDARNIRDTIRSLRATKYDIAIDMRGSLFDSWIAYKSGARIVAGTVGWFYNLATISNRFLLSHAAEYGDDLHPAVDQHKVLAKILGCTDFQNSHPKLMVKREEETATAEFLKKVTPSNVLRIAVHITCGDISRQWPLDYFLQTMVKLNQLYGDRIHFFLIGSSAEVSATKELFDNLQEAGLTNVSDVAGKFRLSQLPAFLKNVDILITNDSGPMHIASAVGTTVIALFIKRFSKVHSPSGSNDVIITTGTDSDPIESIQPSLVIDKTSVLIEQMIQQKERMR